MASASRLLRLETGWRASTAGALPQNVCSRVTRGLFVSCAPIRRNWTTTLTLTGLPQLGRASLTGTHLAASASSAASSEMG